MAEPDTIKLSRECDAGVKMGISSIGDVLTYIHEEELRQCLAEGVSAHETLEGEIKRQLNNYHDDGKEPNPIAKGMSWVKTNVKLAMEGSDAAIADFVTDGCNMGVKSLNKYLNQYQAADETSKDLAKRLISIEEDLAADIRMFL